MLRHMSLGHLYNQDLRKLNFYTHIYIYIYPYIYISGYVHSFKQTLDRTMH